MSAKKSRKDKHTKLMSLSCYLQTKATKKLDKLDARAKKRADKKVSQYKKSGVSGIKQGHQHSDDCQHGEVAIEVSE
jgi:hypothetical protein